MPRLVLFLDDGGVMNDNHRRGPQWQRLLGEFLPPVLGGTPEAWAAVNPLVSARLWDEAYIRATWARVAADYPTFRRAWSLDWLGGMCERVGVPMPPQATALALVGRTTDYATRRVRSAFPGAVEAIRDLHARGHQLHTASGETSTELGDYLEGMGVRDCFGRLFGGDLVNSLKGGAEFYRRIFAEAGIEPADAVVIDDSPAAILRATRIGAKTVLVGSPDGSCAPDLAIATLAELPSFVGCLEA